MGSAERKSEAAFCPDVLQINTLGVQQLVAVQDTVTEIAM